MSIRLTLCTCGIFHFRHYASFMEQQGVLQRIYFSHRVNTLRAIPRGMRRNLFLREYLLYLHIKLLGLASAYRHMKIYNRIWETLLSLFFRPSEINVFLLQGNCLPAIRRAAKNGSIVVGEAVNLHPTELSQVLDADAEHHGVPPIQHRWLVERRLEEIRIVDYLLAPSSAVAESYAKYGFDRAKIFVIPYGSDRAQGPLLKGPHGKSVGATLRVLCVGQIAPRKGHHHLLMAVRDSGGLADFDLTFVGHEIPEYLEALKRIGVPFQHIRHVPHAGMLDFMRDYDVLCLNSIEDGFGMVVTEAMAAGVPVAVSKYAGASELVARCGGGVVYDPHSYSDVISALLLAGRRGAPNLYRPLPTWEDYAQELLTVLGQLSKQRLPEAPAKQ